MARVGAHRFAQPPQPLHAYLPRFLYEGVLLRLKERLLAQYMIVVAFASVFSVDSLRKVAYFGLREGPRYV